MAPAYVTRSPHWYGIPVRVVLLTFIGTLLSFAVSLMFAVIGLLVVWKLHGTRPDMATAYRKIALPTALWGGVIILVLAVITEIRQYRQSRTLSAIEKLS